MEFITVPPKTSLSVLAGLLYFILTMCKQDKMKNASASTFTCDPALCICDFHGKSATNKTTAPVPWYNLGYATAALTPHQKKMMKYEAGMLKGNKSTLEKATKLQVYPKKHIPEPSTSKDASKGNSAPPIKKFKAPKPPESRPVPLDASLQEAKNYLDCKSFYSLERCQN